MSTVASERAAVVECYGRLDVGCMAAGVCSVLWEKIFRFHAEGEMSGEIIL